MSIIWFAIYVVVALVMAYSIIKEIKQKRKRKADEKET